MIFFQIKNEMKSLFSELKQKDDLRNEYEKIYSLSTMQKKVIEQTILIF